MELKEFKKIKLRGGKKMTKIKQERGITLIALVVTIVVLLILAGVSINAIFSDNGIIKRAQEAQSKMDEAQQKDLNSINELNNWLENQVSGKTTGEDDNATVKISTLTGKTAVTKNTKAEDAYGNKITIPKGFKVLANGTATESATYTYSGDKVPTVQDGIVIEDLEGNQFVWVPVGTIKNKSDDSRGTTSTITLGRYSDFTATNGVYIPAQSAENYTQETTITIGENKNYTVAKLAIQNEKKDSIKIDKAIQFEGVEENVKVMKTAPEPTEPVNYKELTTFREGNSTKDSTAQNATARNLAEFISTSLSNGGYYIARFEASGTASKISSKYNQTVLTDITQPNAAKAARDMYGDTTEYASDLVNSYAWDTAIIFIQTYGTGADANSYANKNKSTSFANTGINSDKYCNIFDMSGNAWEWTTEYSTYSDLSLSYPCVYRGGYYNAVNGQAPCYTSNRGHGSTTYSDSIKGLRSLLYVK